jgi:hypothetical protein
MWIRLDSHDGAGCARSESALATWAQTITGRDGGPRLQRAIIHHSVTALVVAEYHRESNDARCAARFAVSLPDPPVRLVFPAIA